ncbi:MAG: SCO family protein [Sphingobacteriia bacterium]|nr:SCO family protein [Sphingobacteriia bacterium]
MKYKNIFILLLLLIFTNEQFACANTEELGKEKFNLITNNDKAFNEKSLKGKISLLYFGFTFCPDVCPATLNNFSLALDELTDSEKENLQFVFITVDPKRDDLKLMKEYMTNFNSNIIGVTGSEEEIDKIIKSYKIYAVKVPNKENPKNYTVDHSTIIYIIDREGKFISFLGHESKPEEIVKEIKKYLK